MNKKQRTLFYIASLAVLFALASFILVGFIFLGDYNGDWYVHLAFGVFALCLAALIMKD